MVATLVDPPTHGLCSLFLTLVRVVVAVATTVALRVALVAVLVVQVS